MVDGHNLGPVERPRCHEIDHVKPLVIGRICRHTSTVSSQLACNTGALESSQDLHNTVLVLTDDSATCVLDVCPVAIIKLHNI